MNIEGQDIETYKTFVVPLDNTKLNPTMRNDSVTHKRNRGMIRMVRKQLRIKNHQVIRKNNQRRN